MRRYFLIGLISVLAALPSWPCFAARENEVIPLELFLGDPVKANPQISPDGTRLAYIAPLDGVLNVWIQDLASLKSYPITNDKDRGIRNYAWAHDRKHLLYLQDKDGNENWHLFAVDISSGGIRDLTPFENVQTQIIALDKHFPNQVVLAMNKEDVKIHDLYRLDLTTREIRMEAKNPGNVTQWVCDNQLKLKAAVFSQKDGSYDLAIRMDDEDSWRTLRHWDLEDGMGSNPIGFSKDGSMLYLIDSKEFNTFGLVKMEINTGNIVSLARDADYDIAGCLIHPDTYEIRMALVVRERQKWIFFEKGLEKDLRLIQRLHRGDITIRSVDDADEKWVIGFVEDTGPVEFYLYNRKTGQGSFLFSNQPELQKYQLNEMIPVQFTARDGVKIHGYLTLPDPGNDKTAKWPMVLLVHGGPWTRDTWGYHPVAQWLTNRGYACLQVNYRGSTGYGKAFVNSANREWGGVMQNDLTDAVYWAISQGFADPERIGIFGASYGGYAALAGAAFTPDLFRCAVDAVGPSNLLTFLNTLPPFWTPELAMIHARVGNPVTDEELLKARSPFFAADKIKIPVLIAQGANDPRVKEAESRQIVEALKRNGVEYEYLLFPDEGHGFAKPGNRLKFYRAAETFLARHLGGRAQTFSKASVETIKARG